MGSVRGASDPNRSGYFDSGTLLFDVLDLLPPDTRNWTKPTPIKAITICWPGGRSAQNVNKKQCEQKRKAWTIDGITPATLEANPNQWPHALIQWQKDKRVVDLWQGPPIIESLNDDQHIGAPLTPINLVATSQGAVDWYLDGKWLVDGILHPGIKVGEHRLTVVDIAGRSSEITFEVK